MEYMALGKPVIATDGGGTREIVINGQTGFLIGDSQVEEFMEKIILLLNDYEVSKSMGNAGKERTINEFNSNIMTDNHIKLYEDVLIKKT